MADVFISYSNIDRAEAAGLAALLEERGYSVWWDRDLVGGEQFHEVIRRVLQECRVAIVIWTSSSIQSRWVLGEAETAAGANKLIPVRAEQLAADQIPIAFRALQTIEIRDHEGLIDAVASKLMTAPKVMTAWQLFEFRTLRRLRGVSRWLSFPRVVTLLFVVLIVGYGVASTMEWLRIRDSFNANDFRNYLKWAFLNPYAGAARAKLSGQEQWKSIMSSTNVSALQRFADEYPNSLYAPFTRLRIKRLGAVGSGYVPVFSESMYGPLDAEKLATLNCKQLWIARNEIFYLLGRCFTSEDAWSVFHTDQDPECRLASCQAINDINSTVENIMSPDQMSNALTILQQERKQGCRITPSVDACEKKP